MNLVANPIRFGIPALIILALAAGLAFWAWGTGGGAAGGGLGDSARIRGMVELTHFDADGNVIYHRLEKNTTVDGLKTDAASRLGISSTLADSDLYDFVLACSNNAGGSTCTISDLDSVDGASHDNPLDGSGATGSSPGEYDVVVTFTCTGTCIEIEELQLVKGAPTNNQPGTVGAHQNVDVVLSNGDTLLVTWTIDIG